jgi:broad specificity phosphatase PhoE
MSKKNRLFLIRHGETNYNLNHQMQGRGIDASLNATGFTQAEAVADYLGKYHIDQVVSSSMLRARQTAGAITKALGMNLISHNDLDEMNFGYFEGLFFDDIEDEIEKVHQIWSGGDTSYRIPGGESPEEVFERADKRIHQYLDDLNGDNIVFVVHGRVIRILLSEWTGIGLRNMHLIEHANGAVNHLIKNGNGFDVVYLNKTDHLVDLVGG